VSRPRIGTLALQGAFRAHVERLRAFGVDAIEVRTPAELGRCDALVMPGGESTTMSNLLATSGLFEPIAERIESGMPTFGTCAGMILLAVKILDGRSDQRCFGALDIAVRRNGYGRQIDSFEADLDIDGFADPFHGVFIRAPRIETVGDGVEVLASYDDEPVLVRHGHLMAASFHPELTTDGRLHGLFVEAVEHH
jgi:pyridoxal 5'-phosphate synthase pdxT subunit